MKQQDKILKKIKGNIVRLEEILDKHRSTVFLLEENRYFFRVTLTCLWGQGKTIYDGEQGESLSKVAKRAVLKYQKDFRRNDDDMQAAKVAEIVFENGQILSWEYPKDKKKMEK